MMSKPRGTAMMGPPKGGEVERLGQDMKVVIYFSLPSLPA